MPADLQRVQAITTEEWLSRGPLVTWHVGDLAWQSRWGDDRTEIELVDDAAFLFHSTADDWVLGALPGREDGLTSLLDRVPWTRILTTEREKIRVLEANGFRPAADGWDWHLVHALTDLPEVVLPEGFVVRDATDSSTREPRVDVHRKAWEPSRFSLEQYDVVQSVQPYDPTLDIGVVASDGEWVSYCICWFDPVAKTGELEPVGTAPSFRRLGLGAAACLSALHRLRERGATACVVYADSRESNPGPRALYESIGFNAADRALRFDRA